MWFSKYGKYLFLTNISIASSSLLFQVTVLYPWHNEISQDLKKLTDKINSKT